MAPGMDVRSVRRVLRESGLSNRATWSLLLPFGRRARMETMLRNRRSVLEAKNAVLDRLFRLQKALEPNGPETGEQAQAALHNPEQQRLLVTLGMSRASLVEDFNLTGVACGAALDEALRELLGERRVLRVVPPGEVAGGDLYVVVHKRGRGRYNTAAIDRLLERGTQYGERLRARERRANATNEGRTYRL